MAPRFRKGRTDGTVTVFWKTFASTVIPIVALSIVGTAAAIEEVSGAALWLGFYLVYGVAGVWLVATIAKVVLYARGTRENASGILKVFAWTVIPIVFLSIVSTAGAAIGLSGSRFWLGFYIVWYGAAGMWLVATIAMVVLYVRGSRDRASAILKAFAWTATPIVTLSIVSTVGAAYGPGFDFSLGFYSLWGVAVGIEVVATLAMVFLYARGKRESASGVLAGVGVGVLAVGTTGLVNFATIQATFQ